jgi:hypothetical protein
MNHRNVVNTLATPNSETLHHKGDHMNKKAIFMSLVALGFGVSSIANASPHFVAGAKCVVRSGPAAGYGVDASINNPGTSTQTLVCPGDTLDLATDVTSKISVTDNTTTDEVCCATKTRNANGGTIVTGSLACTILSTTGADQFLLPGDVGPVSGTFNYHWLQCTVPPISGLNRSSVNGYRILDI